MPPASTRDLTSGGPTERLGDGRGIDDDCFDTVTSALDFGDELGHLVAVEHVVGLSVNIDHCHGCRKLSIITLR